MIPRRAVATALLFTLDDNELRVLHERVARVHRLRLDMLALERAQALVQWAQRKR